MQVSREYFHLIRHPQSGAVERGKLITALAIISCLTGVVPAGFGLVYLIGRIVQGSKDPKVAQAAQHVLNTAPISTPVGIPNFGNSCWTAAGVQALLSCEHIQEIAKGELKIGMSSERIRLENGNWTVVDRPESPEEFQNRKNIQNSLMEILDIYQQRQPKAFKQALIRFQENIRDSGASLMPVTVKGRNDARNLFLALEHAFQGVISVTGLSLSTMMNPDEELSERFQEMQNSQILVIESSDEKLNTWDVDAILELSKGQLGKYRLMGLTLSTGSHAFAYVRRGNEWYHCNDSKVKTLSLKTIPLDGKSRLIFERI